MRAEKAQEAAAALDVSERKLREREAGEAKAREEAAEAVARRDAASSRPRLPKEKPRTAEATAQARAADLEKAAAVSASELGGFGGEGGGGGPQAAREVGLHRRPAKHSGLLRTRQPRRARTNLEKDAAIKSANAELARADTVVFIKPHA